MFADKLLPSLWQRFAPLVGPAGVEVVHLSGTARFSESPISAIYAGNGRNLAFLRNLFFSQTRETTLQRTSTPLGLSRALQHQPGKVDLCLSELPPAWRLLQPNSVVRVPAWIRQEIALPPAPQAGGWLLSRSLEREARRHVNRYGYRAEFTAAMSADVARTFYRELYRPYVRSRFGEAAVVVSEPVFLAACRGQMLAKLLAGSDWVAGMLLLRRGEQMRFGWFGACTDPPPPGASEVLDVLSIHHAHRSGTRRVILGNSRPCLTDGVVRYKARFHPQLLPIRFPQASLGIDVVSFTEPVLECLERQPLLAPLGDAMGVYRVIRGDDSPPCVRLEALHVDS